MQVARRREVYRHELYAKVGRTAMETDDSTSRVI